MASKYSMGQLCDATLCIIKLSNVVGLELDAGAAIRWFHLPKALRLSKSQFNGIVWR